ncbi:MAG: histidinol-phosphate transaminase [Myxococcota bacterium]
MRPRDLAKAHIRDLQPYRGGKPIEELEREQGIHEAIKLASNECPEPPSESVLEALRSALGELNRYPDGDAHRLSRALAEHLGLEDENLFLGAGSDEILEIIVKCFLGPGDEAVFPWPSFAMYPIVTRGMGARARRVALDAELGVDIDALLEAVSERTRLVFLANPNNPTGRSIGRESFDRLLRELPEHVLLVNDEAYFEYVRRPDYPDALHAFVRRPTLVTLRTFSKIHGLAGLRLGYAFADPELIDLLERARHPFNVSHLAQVAGRAALEDGERVARVRRRTHEELEQLERAFEELQLRYTPSDANFVLVQIGPEALRIHERLLAQGVITRPMAAFGLPDHLRVTVGLPQENKRFLEALRRELAR